MSEKKPKQIADNPQAQVKTKLGNPKDMVVEDIILGSPYKNKWGK